MKFYKKITEKSKSNSLVVLVSEDTDSINFSNDSVNLLFSESLSNEDLSSLGKITVLHTPDSLYKNFNFLRIICIGVGSLEEIDSNKIRRAAGSFGRYFLDSKLLLILGSINFASNKYNEPNTKVNQKICDIQNSGFN